MKKLSLIVCILLVGALLAGCASGDASSTASSAPASVPASAPASEAPASTPESEAASTPPASQPDAPSTTPSGEGSSADYQTVIQQARPSELNELQMFNIVTDPEDPLYTEIFNESFGLVAADMERYAISLGLTIVQTYGVAIILPREGRYDAVLAQVNAYVEAQQKSMENYLQDQYEIAKGAIVKTADTGEILLAMCEGAADVMAKMEQGLAAG